MPSFIFSVLTTDYLANSTKINPIMNTNDSFSGLSSDITTVDDTTTITWS
jgi:hypothetical protein